jgi:hypothetical protein
MHKASRYLPPLRKGYAQTAGKTRFSQNFATPSFPSLCQVRLTSRKSSCLRRQIAICMNGETNRRVSTILQTLRGLRLRGTCGRSVGFSNTRASVGHHGKRAFDRNAFTSATPANEDDAAHDEARRGGPTNGELGEMSEPNGLEPSERGWQGRSSRSNQNRTRASSKADQNQTKTRPEPDQNQTRTRPEPDRPNRRPSDANA